MNITLIENFKEFYHKQFCSLDDKKSYHAVRYCYLKFSFSEFHMKSFICEIHVRYNEDTWTYILSQTSLLCGS